MERNARLYECAKRLVDVARILLPFDQDIKEQILDIATLITQRIVVDEKEIGEIEKYEQQLKG
jgi:hypothetical protein